MAGTQESQINIDDIPAETIIVPIVGTSPLIVHNWSVKAKRMMLEKEQGKKQVKETRDPQAEYEAAFYRIDKGDGVERYGFPVTAFKAATVGAARFYGKDVTMTQLRQSLFFHGIMTPADKQQLVEIVGEPRMREDMVRMGGMGRNADLRYRPEFPEWRAELRITYVRTAIQRSSVLSLIDAGGFGVGVGEWRPEKSGEFGTYRVDVDREVRVIG